MEKSTHLTISLTGRAPVRIARAEWPLMASAKAYDGEIECQANRRWFLGVRMHADDGRAIVSGNYSTQWRGEADLYGGEIVESGGDVAAAIRRVGETIGASEPTIARCIADLPAVEI